MLRAEQGSILRVSGINWPVIVVSNDQFNRIGEAIVCPILSNIPQNAVHIPVSVSFSSGEIKGLIDQGAFDFSKSENDMFILKVLNNHEGDQEKAIAYLKDYWAEDYETYYALYEADDVFAGIYHGSGEDMTERISAYLDDIITSGAEELRGCVVVTEELAQILQKLMDKFTFENVDHSWRKLCYYYDYMG